MCRKMSLVGLGAAIALSLVVFAACKEADEDPVGPSGITDIAVTIGKVTIINIPETVGGGASYKVFVQLASGQNAEDGAVALGSKEIGAAGEQGFKDNSGSPWTEAGRYYVAVVVSPATVTSSNDIAVYAPMMQQDFSSPLLTFDLTTFLKLNDIMPGKVPQIFNGEGLPADQTGVICVPDSGINYPANLGKQ
ncbi:hypothetical protein AGMMS50267_02670 [Spirochaetia bacterium]|nr:hypothetical protein AGMMS50267_02670 [Spirochaetia bacterium]